MKTNLHPLNLLPLLATVLLAGLPCTQAATILANDNFTLSAGSGTGTVNNTQSAGVGTYSTVQGSNGMTVTTLSGFGSGNVLSINSTSNTYYRAFNAGTSFTLNSLAANETLRLVYNVRFDGSFTGADNFSFGFVNTTLGSEYSILYGNLDLVGPNPTDRQSEFRYRAGSFNMSDNVASTIIGSAFTEPVTATSTAYTFQLDVTKQSGGGFNIEYYRDSSLIGSALVTSGSFLTTAATQNITGLAFRHAQAPGVSTYFDNVTVTVIPEPQALALLSASLVCTTLFRARRRLLP